MNDCTSAAAVAAGCGVGSAGDVLGVWAGEAETLSVAAF